MVLFILNFFHILENTVRKIQWESTEQREFRLSLYALAYNGVNV